MRRRQVASVAEFEFLSIVRTKGYLLATLGMPALLLLYAVFANWFGTFIERSIDGDPQVFGVIDSAGLLDLREDLAGSLLDLPEPARMALEQSGADSLGPIAHFTDTVFRGFDDSADATRAFLAGQISGYIVIPEDFVQSGEIDVYSSDDVRAPRGTARENLAGLLLERFQQQVPETIRARLSDPIATHRDWVIDDAGATHPYDRLTAILRVLVPGAFTLTFLIALLTTTGYLVQGVSTEKENRVVEVLLSSTSPDEILAGKLFGLGAAGLLQVLVWFSMVIFGATIAAGIAVAAGVTVPWKALITGTLFFVAAYFFYGAIMLAFASFGNSQQEGQKLAAVWTMLAVLPMMLFPAILNTPHGTIARVMTFIPFSAPLTVLGRVALDPEGVQVWELALSLGVLVVSTWLALKLGARLFRIGLLALGSRPKLKEIWRQARAS